MKLVVRLPILILLLLIPTSSVATPSDLTGHKGETVFFLLGMLGEYSGRTFVEDSDLVERFYCNEHEVAFVFRAYLQRLAGEQALNRTIEEEWRQDFANSSKKRDLIRRLLEEMGCDSVVTSSREGLPYSNGISFVPTDELQGAFETMPCTWALELAGSSTDPR